MLVNNADKGSSEFDDHYTDEFYAMVDQFIAESNSTEGKFKLYDRYMKLNVFQANYLKSEVLKKRIGEQNAKLDSSTLSKDDYDKAVKDNEDKLTRQIDEELPVRKMEYDKCYFSDKAIRFLVKSVLAGKTTTEAYRLLHNDESQRQYIESVIQAEKYDIDAQEFIDKAKDRSHSQSFDVLESIVRSIKEDRSTLQSSAYPKEEITVLASGFLGKEYLKFYCQSSFKVLLSRLARSVTHVLAAAKLSGLEVSLSAKKAKERDKRLSMLENTNAVLAEGNRDVLCWKKIVSELIREDPNLKPRFIKEALLGITQCDGKELKDNNIRGYLLNLKNKSLHT